jgi:hypothetical protein
MKFVCLLFSSLLITFDEARKGTLWSWNPLCQIGMSQTRIHWYNRDTHSPALNHWPVVVIIGCANGHVAIARMRAGFFCALQQIKNLMIVSGSIPATRQIS